MVGASARCFSGHELIGRTVRDFAEREVARDASCDRDGQAVKARPYPKLALRRG